MNPRGSGALAPIRSRALPACRTASTGDIARESLGTVFVVTDPISFKVID
jgi:hypothetical protein